MPQSLVGNPYIYTGRRLDAETGLVYYRARYYDPGLGRFIGRDPIGYSGGVSLYVYVKDAPTSLVDPSGLITWEIVLSVQRHHWFPVELKPEIETLCKAIGFSIDAFQTPLLYALDRPVLSTYEGLTGVEKPHAFVNGTFNDHYWIHNVRSPTWNEIVAKHLGESTTCCLFLTTMLPEIKTAYSELQARARARGDNWYQNDFSDSMRPYVSKFPGDSGDFPASEGTDEIVTNYSYSEINTTTLLMKSISDACDPNCKKPINVLKTVRDNRRPRGQSTGGSMNVDPVPSMLIGGLGALGVKAVGSAAVGVVEGVGEGVGEGVSEGVSPGIQSTPLRPVYPNPNTPALYPSKT